MTGPLQGPHDHQLQEISRMQARRRRIEPAIIGDRPVSEGLPQGYLVGGYRDQAARGQVIEHVGHERSLPHHAVQSAHPARMARTLRPEWNSFDVMLLK